MKAPILAMSIALSGAASLATAQDFVPGSSYLLPAAWAGTDSAYAAAAREIDYKFLKGTDKQPNFSPAELNAGVGRNLDTRLSQKLDRQLAEEPQQEEMEVGAN